MRRTVGQNKIRIGNNKMKETGKIKELRKTKAIMKREYEHALKHNRESITEKQQNYFNAQKELKNEIEKTQTEMTRKKLEKLANEGSTKSNTIWKMRAETEKQTEQEPYDTITEDDIHLQAPDETRDYIANYYENLYQARPSKPEYIKETEEIETEIRRIEIEMSNLPPIEQFSHKELNTAIKKLKRKKALGPDEIPNEAFIEADEQTRSMYLNSMNQINKEMSIPEIWQDGEIIRLYKCKGTKGKCSNERGITLSSNFGKLYERIINERVLGQVKMSDAQAGGKRGAATVDHILLAKELIATAKRNKKDAYIAFLDVTKAYDKAWLTGIMNVMYKEGLKDNHWTIVRKLNQNLTARIQTKYGNTRKISITDSIRQGGVLSTTLYGLLMDEVSKEVKKEDMGIKIDGINEKQGCLLWVDDVLLINTEKVEFQKSLDITNETSNKYHVEYGEPKSNAMKIKHTRKKVEEEKFHLGEMQLKNTPKYKYLGLLQNDKNNLDDHMEAVRGKTEAAYQKMMALTGNSSFMLIEMETIWMVVQACITPIIVYAGETWEMTTKNYKKANMLLDNILKRILKTPKGTPREALYMETGLLDPETIVMKNRITMEARLRKGNSQIMKEIINLKTEKSWAEENRKLKKNLGITEEDMLESTYKLKNNLRKNMNLLFHKKLTETAENKSKMKYYLEGIQNWEPGKRANYMNKLTRNQTSIIFKARTRMLKMKANYKNGNSNLTCRACGKAEETQTHVLEECSTINKEQPSITKEMIFTTSVKELKTTTGIIEKRLEILDNSEKH